MSKFIGAILLLLLLWTPLSGQNYPMPSSEFELGALYKKDIPGVEFRLWAPTAKGVTVSLFDKPAAPFAQALATVTLAQNPDTGVWTGTFQDQDPAGMFYEYRVDSTTGLKRVLDPYAQSVEGFKGTGFLRGAVVDPRKTIPEGGWQGGEDLNLKNRTDAVIYEVNIRDFTISPDLDIPEAEKGTYQGFLRRIPYLKSLGITHVQIMPIQNFMYNDETKKAYDGSDKTVGTNYNWGYGPQGYFAPEGWYSSDPWDPHLRVKEVKTLVRELHKAGIGVILDVVYNHMGTPSLLENILPNYFFRQNGSGKLTNDTYTGNDVNTSAPMARKLIVDSLVWWTKEYKVDGFRFDLMGQIDAQTIMEGYKQVSALPGKSDTLFLGEGWKTYRQKPLPGGMMDQNYMTKTDQVAVFNDSLRNLLKGDANNPRPGFLTGEDTDSTRLFHNLIGRLSVKEGDPYTSDNPGDNVQHLEVHDGLRLHDALSWVLFEGENTPAHEQEILRRLKLGHLLLFTAQGIPLLHQGQEFAWTKPNPLKSSSETKGPFVNNSYQAADSINRIPGTLTPVQNQVKDYTAGLIALRLSQPIFRLPTQDQVDKAAFLLNQTRGDVLSYGLKTEKGVWYILANASQEKQIFKIPALSSRYQVYVDQDRAGTTPINNPQGITSVAEGVELAPLTGAVIFAPGK